MNGKKAKQLRNVEEAKQKESSERMMAFKKDIEAASEKHRFDIVAALQYKNTAIIPVIAFVDVKEKYEHLTAEAKKAEEAKKQAQTAEVKETPKLEV